LNRYANTVSYERAREAVEKFSQGKSWLEEDDTGGSLLPTTASGHAGVRKRGAAASDNEEDGIKSAGSGALRDLLLGAVPQGMSHV
jgi:hypothetical protein